ncbi:NUDIX domain-containing protein [Streptomyces viridochromogenes]|uniref:NUDIX domain-containing protein n=1 Tax=Streptomyces viridochromogenes TaxID=1938 RepID=UPI000AC379AC|nr:NUDIX domain-containing protein [Streptomyces viridochromogenes]
MSPYLSPANVMVLVQRDDGRVLAVRHNETSKTSPNQVTVVGGKLEQGEFVHEGALRELTEETGVHVAAEDLEFCQLVHYRSPDGVRVIGTVFTAQRWRGEPRNAEPHKPADPVDRSRKSASRLPPLHPAGPGQLHRRTAARPH